MNVLLVAFMLGLMVVGSALALMMLGVYVVRRYPNPGDPARNAPRFVRPAGFLLALCAGSVVGFMVAAIVAMTT